MALGSLLAETGLLGSSVRAADQTGGALAVRGRLGRIRCGPRLPPLPARAKRVVHLFMNGGPSHVDTFDPKPMLTKYHGKPVPTNLPTERKTGAAFRSPYTFRKYGQSGIEVSEIFAHTAEMIDEICVIRSMHADVPNHEPSLMLMNCGEARQARPSLGSWVLYGLGAENQNLPGFLVMCPGGYPIAESQNWQAAFLPGIYQGTYVDPKHTDIEKLIAHIRNHGVGPPAQRAQLDLLAELNRAAPRRAAARGRARGADPVVRAGLPDAIGSGRGVRHQPRAGLHPGDVRPGRARPISFWPRGGCSSGASGSSSSGTARGSPGTITTTSKPATASWAGSATRPSARSSRT